MSQGSRQRSFSTGLKRTELDSGEQMVNRPVITHPKALVVSLLATVVFGAVSIMRCLHSLGIVDHSHGSRT